MLASDCELCIAEFQLRVEDFSVAGAIETWMKFPDSLGCSGIARGVRLQQILRLISEMIEIRIRWEQVLRA